MESFHKLVTSWLLILATRVSVTSKSLLLILVLLNMFYQYKYKIGSFQIDWKCQLKRTQ